MKIEFETKYQSGDTVWVTGYRKDGEVIPVRAKVGWMTLGKASEKHAWLIEYGVWRYADDDIALGFEYRGDPIHDIPYSKRPLYEVSKFESDMFPTKEAWEGWKNESPF